MAFHRALVGLGFLCLAIAVEGGVVKNKSKAPWQVQVGGNYQYGNTGTVQQQNSPPGQAISQKGDNQPPAINKNVQTLPAPAPPSAHRKLLADKKKTNSGPVAVKQNQWQITINGVTKSNAPPVQQAGSGNTATQTNNGVTTVTTTPPSTAP